MCRLVLAFLLFGSVLSQFAQQVPPAAPASAVQSTPAFRAEPNLVTVHFQYTPKKGSAAGLRPGDLELSEDGAPQKISLLQGGRANPQTAPLEVNLLFAYMRPAQEQVVPPWLRGAKFDLAAIDDGQRVSVAIWAVGNGLRRLCEPTRDATQLNRAMDEVVQVWADSANNDTTLLEAIGAVIQQSAQGRRGVTRILAVLTREEIDYQYGGPEAVSAAQANGIAIYPITVGMTSGGGSADFSDSAATSSGVDNDMLTPPKRRREAALLRTPARRRESALPLNDGLSWLARVTNGQRWDLNSTNPQALWDMILQRLAGRIQNDYVAEYVPASGSQTGLRKVQLSLKRGVGGQVAPKELYVRR
jgi:hypothetical protein